MLVHSLANIIHRDIKPENMLLSKNGVLKICDFGWARAAVENQKYTEYCSTRWYRAPELLVGDASYGKAVDVWAIGCIFVELLTGQPLFTGETDYATLTQILTTFAASESLPDHLIQAFHANSLFQGASLPAFSDNDIDIDATTE